MNTYRAHLNSSWGRRIELIEFACEDDAIANDTVSHHIQTNQTADLWQGRRLVSRVTGRIAPWERGCGQTLRAWAVPTPGGSQGAGVGRPRLPS